MSRRIPSHSASVFGKLAAWNFGLMAGAKEKIERLPSRARISSVGVRFLKTARVDARSAACSADPAAGGGGSRAKPSGRLGVRYWAAAQNGAAIQMASKNA